MIFKKALLGSGLFILTTHLASAACPYFGGGIGIGVNTADNARVNYRGIPFNLFLGFGGVYAPNFYFGGEITGTLLNSTLTNHGLKTTYGLKVSAIPGFMISDHAMVFGRLGLGKYHFRNDVERVRTMGELGLGVQNALTQNVDLRLEYNYLMTRSNGIEPRSDQTMLSIVYKME